MRLRRSRADIMRSIDEKPSQDGAFLVNNIADPRPNPEEVYALEERRRMLKRRLQALPCTYRSALWMRDVEGMNTREAAGALGLTVANLKSQLRRARLRLSKEVGTGGACTELHTSAASPTRLRLSESANCRKPPSIMKRSPGEFSSLVLACRLQEGARAQISISDPDLR